MPELAAYLKATGEADPLVGNYVLLRQDDVVLAYQGAGEQFLLQAFEVSAGKTPKLEQSGKLDVGAPQPSQHDTLAAGDFDGNHLDEIASAYSEAGTLKLVTARNQDPATTAHSLSLGSKPVEVGAFGGGRIGLAAGHFVLASDTSGVQPSTLALAWSDASGHLHIEIWGTDTKLAPKRIAAATGPKVSAGNLALAAADLDGDGKSGMVVAWQGSADSKGRDLFMCLYRLDTTGKALTASTVIPVAALGGNASFDLAGGQFSSLSTSEEVALAWSDKKKHANAQLFKLDSKGAFVTAGKGYVDSANPVTDSMLVRLAAGDLDLDGIDELVLGSVGTKDSNPAILFLHILKPDNELNLNLPGPHSLGAIIGEPNTAFASIDCQLAIGELGPGRLLGIVVGALGTKGLSGLAGKAELAVGVVEVDPALDLPPVRSVGALTAAQIIPDAAEDPKLNITLGLALGDFSGKSIRVGPPKHHNCPQVNGVIAIINTPPAEANINYNMGPDLTFTNSKEEQTNFDVSVTKDWTWSKDLGGNLGLGSIAHLNASMTRTYGKDFSKTHDSIKTVTSSLNATLAADDAIILSVTNYDVWEYPVFDDTTGAAKGQLLVVFPDPDGVGTLPLWGTSEYLDYFPEHQLGTLLSYSDLRPADFGTPISADQYTLDVGVNSTSITYSWGTSTTKTKQTSSRVDLISHESVNFTPTLNFLGGISIGLNASFTGTYDKTSISSHTITYTDTTSIEIDFPPIPDRTAEYLVTPYLYFSSEGGFLVVDYKVEANDTGYWKTTYGAPAANLNLLYANDSSVTGDDLTRTRAIFFDYEKDGSVNISVRVSNYSLVEALEVSVSFHDGDPTGTDSTPIGNPYVIPKLPARGNVLVRQEWKPGDPKTNRKIFVALAPTTGGSQIAPVQGWTPWPPLSSIQQAKTAAVIASG
jgi:hypothetical protein